MDGFVFEQIPEGRLTPLIREFARDEANLEKSEFVAESDTIALAYIMGYPSWRQSIGEVLKQIRYNALSSLDAVQIAATRYLMRRAESQQLNSGPLWEFCRICREIFREDPVRPLYGETIWPECMGDRTKLSDDYRKSIRDGEEVFMRLVAIMEIAPDSLAEAIARKGRPISSNADLDQRISDAMAEDGSTRDSVAADFDIDPEDVRKACDRHRKRTRNK